MYDSLKIFELGYAASYSEVKSQFRALARIYYPDKHDLERTGMLHTDAKIFFQLINNAHEYLKDKL
jgi:DnaJ-class molecular chaperone